MLKRLVLFITMVCVIAPFAHAKENMLTMAWNVNVGPLNPHGYVPNQMFAQGMVYDPLVRFENNAIVPALAESWTISEDGLTYTFKLRKGVKFSDGTPFDSKAVAMNFEAVIEGKARHSWLELVNVLDSWKAIDAHTFVMKLKKPYNLTLIELSLQRPFRFLSPTGFIDPSKPSTAKIKAPIGTGAWKLTEIKLGEYDILERNDLYWDKMPSIEKIKVLVLPDPESRVVALETGKIDIIIGEGMVTLENFSRISKDENYEALKSLPRMSSTVAIESTDKVAGDLAVRKAIQHAINKEAIVKYILLDLEIISHQFFNPALPYANVGLVPYDYNIEKANKILDDAGWKRDGRFRFKNDQKLEIDLHYIGSNAKQKAVAEAIQAELAKVGITLNLQAEENTIFYSLQQNGGYGMIFNNSWGPPYEPASFLASMRIPTHADYSAQAGLPSKKQIDESITKILYSFDEAEKQELYTYVFKQLHDNAVYLPLSYEQDLVLFKKGRIKNFKFGEMTTEFLFNYMELQ